METILQKLFFGVISLFVSVYFKKLAGKGIIRIGDLFSDNNELIIKNDRRLR